MLEPRGDASALFKGVDALRKKLLDLTMRNRMVNFRPSRKYGVSVVGEQSLLVYDAVVERQRKMGFEGTPDTGRGQRSLEGVGEAASQALLSESAQELPDGPVTPIPGSVDPSDGVLHVPMAHSVVHAKLRITHRQEQLAREELGVHTLFLTLGMLEWREAEASKAPLLSPLVFVPVELEKSRGGTLKLNYDGGEIGDNLPLQAKLREQNVLLPEFDQDKGLESYFEEVEQAVGSRPDWAVRRDDIQLGFFSYEKYAMYVDLGGENWPEGRQPWLHRDIGALLGRGYSDAETSAGDDTFLDSLKTVADSHEVLDADSSQRVALIRASEGHSMVVEGPPGTGKSQTITNLIAEAIYDGRTVLFVSAKKAALDVVARKLSEVGLADAFIDLHDKGVSRTAFYTEIKRTLDQNNKYRSLDEQVRRLGELREQLNEHCFAVNEPLQEWGISPFEALSELARLPEEDKEDLAARVPFAKLSTLRGEDLRRVLPRIRALQERVARIGIPAQHPFYGVGIERVDRSIRLELEVNLSSAIEELSKVDEVWKEACSAIGVDLPASGPNIVTLQLCLDRVQAAPPHEGVSMTADSWEQDAPAIREVLAALRQFQSSFELHKAMVKPEIWGEDLSSIAEAYEKHSTKLLRGLIGEFKAARSKLTEWMLPSAHDDDRARNVVLLSVRQAQTALALVHGREGLVKRLFGSHWASESTAPDLIEGLLEWVLSLRAEVASGALPAGLLTTLAKPTSQQEACLQVQTALSTAQQAVGRTQPLLARMGYVPNATEAEFALLRQRFERWQASLERLDEYLEFRRVRDGLAQDGLDAVVELAERWLLAGARLTDLVARSYWYGIVDRAMSVRPALKHFDREAQESAIEEFCRLDNVKLEYNRALARKAHQDRLPKYETAGGQLQTLRQQCELKRRQKSIRWIMSHAGEAVQRIKPVFMMSPLTVAIHLPPSMPPFDMVVFDEASQVKPEDALCAISRAKQCVVVGDTRQMPPTNFFDNVADDDDDSDEDETTLAAKHMESVLSLMNSAVHQSVRKPDLRWHYRSLDPRLIQPSNEIIYDNRLVVFPSASSELAGRRTGVYWNEVKGVYAPGSSKRYNEIEAEAVCEAVLCNMRERPGESVLVAAMNKQQADLIYFKLQAAERTAGDVFERHRVRHPFEPLDVKNLETVQGDERDVVFVSVTYGPDDTGVVHQRFGPINSEGGERRLNVLFTRARQRCEVFSSMRSDQIKVSANQSGVAAFKRYLQFAESGSTDIAIPTGRSTESPFEQQVLHELNLLGYEVHTQVGTEGYRIDLAVVDPDVPGRYILGVECDGATYHSARSARDRDKLRQAVLERRGWNIHRIWSLDWWQGRQGEVKRVAKRIESLRSLQPAATAPEVEPMPPPLIVMESNGPKEETPPLARPYVVTPPYPRSQPNWLLLHSGQVAENFASQSQEVSIEFWDYMKSVVRHMAEHEGPIHREFLIHKLREVLGYKRLKSANRIWVESQLPVWTAGLQTDGESYWFSPKQATGIRDWGTAPDEFRKVDYLPTIEIANAIRLAVKASIEIRPEEIAQVVMKLLGFKRVTEPMRVRVLEVVDQLRQAGQLVPGLNSSQHPSGTLRLAQPPKP